MDELAVRRIEVRVCSGPSEVGVLLAQLITQDMQTVLGKRDHYLLGCPGGRTFIPTYRALALTAAQSGIDWSRVVFVMMDDYVLETPTGLRRCPEEVHYSCHRFAQHEIVEPINSSGLPEQFWIPDTNLWLPDVNDPGAYDARIEEWGGIDLFLLASGSSDGHVAFNPPGSTVDSKTRVVDLADTTRSDNLATFPGFDSIDDVPSMGITVGLGTISRFSRRVIMALLGDSKQYAARRLLSTGMFETDWPASIVHECAAPAIYLDRSAFAGVDHVYMSSNTSTDRRRE